METSEKTIKKLCVDKGISYAELAKRMEKSPQSFSQLNKRRSLNLKELCEVGKALDYGFNVGIEISGVFYPFSEQLKQSTLDLGDLKEIARCVEGEFRTAFTQPDGTIVEYK